MRQPLAYGTGAESCLPSVSVPLDPARCTLTLHKVLSRQTLPHKHARQFWTPCCFSGAFYIKQQPGSGWVERTSLQHACVRTPSAHVEEVNIRCRCHAATEAAWACFRNAWTDMHPLSTARRLEALAQLQPLAEVQVRKGLSHAVAFEA